MRELEDTVLDVMPLSSNAAIRCLMLILLFRCMTYRTMLTTKENSWILLNEKSKCPQQQKRELKCGDNAWVWRSCCRNGQTFGAASEAQLPFCSRLSIGCEIQSKVARGQYHRLKQRSAVLLVMQSSCRYLVILPLRAVLLPLHHRSDPARKCTA